MSDELRMALADCGSPERLIAAVLAHYPDLPVPVPILDLSYDVGIIGFEEFETSNFVGALVTDELKSRGSILTQKGLHEYRRRFTIGHELGHFLIPSHVGNQQCSNADLRQSGRADIMQRRETEANRFSAGMLMPKPWFLKDLIKLGSVDVGHAQELRTRYKCSLEAVVARYVDLSSEICAFVFSLNGVIRYFKAAKNFPSLNITAKSHLPSRSASAKSGQMRTGAPSRWTEVSGEIWLKSEWGKPTPNVLEQSLVQSNGYKVTLLHIDEKILADEDEQRDLEESWTPKFRK